MCMYMCIYVYVRTEAAHRHRACKPLPHWRRQATHVVQLAWPQPRHPLHRRDVVRLSGPSNAAKCPMFPLRDTSTSRGSVSYMKSCL